MKKYTLDDFLMHPGTVILRISYERNITLSKIAEYAEMSDSQISKIVNNKCDPRLSSILKIAKVLGLLERGE